MSSTGCSNLIFEGQIEMYDYPPFRKELFDLIHDRARRKVDHPDGSCLMPWTEVYLYGEINKEVRNLVGIKGLKTLSVDLKGKIVVGDVVKVWQTGFTEEYYKITLATGKSFDVTGNHPIMLHDGIYVPAEKVKPRMVLKDNNLIFDKEKYCFGGYSDRSQEVCM